MLTPIDIQNREIKSKMGGYDKKDVDDFLEEIRGSYEELYKENQSLKEKISSLSEGIQYYKKMESTLQKALVLAEKTSTETQEAAKTQADSVMSEATAKAEAMTREAKAEIESLRREAQAQTEITKAKANRELEETRNHVRKLVQSYENYRLQFKKLAEAQIEMLDSESFSIFVPELEELMIILMHLRLRKCLLNRYPLQFRFHQRDLLAIFRQTIQKAQQVRSLMLPELMQSRR